MKQDLRLIVGALIMAAPVTACFIFWSEKPEAPLKIASRFQEHGTVVEVKWWGSPYIHPKAVGENGPFVAVVVYCPIPVGGHPAYLRTASLRWEDYDKAGRPNVGDRVGVTDGDSNEFGVVRLEKIGFEPLK